MADHWKSLANLLGAPGVDLPEETENKGSPAQDARKPESRRREDPPASIEEKPEPPEPAPAEPPSTPKEKEVRSHWGFRDKEPQTDSEETDEVALQPEVIQAVTPKPKEAPKPVPSQVEPEGKPLEKSARKSGRRSSWESLASMFNIKLEPRSEPDEPPSQPDASPVGESVGKQEAESRSPKPWSEKTEKEAPRVFDDADTRSEENPALTALFGDASSKPQSDDWYQKRRVVDDVGGWEDEGDSVGSHEASRYGFQPREEEKDDLTAEREAGVSERSPRSESEGRRGRRRRGRGRGRGEVPIEDTVNDDVEVPSDADTARYRGVSWKDEDDSRRGMGDDVEEEVERRSSRRRRRGRRPAAEDRPETEDSAIVSEPDFSTAEDFEEKEEAEYRERKPSRRRRERPKRVPVSDSVIDDAELDEDAPDSSEDDEERAVRHRNIPTWEDALRSIIESNTENHRKNEGRGHRGRSRGRR